MSKIGSGLGMDVPFHLAPEAFVITDAFAPGANRDQAPQSFHILQRRGQLFGDPPRLQEDQNLPRQDLHGLYLLRRKLAGLPIDRAKRTERITLLGYKREPGVKPNMRSAGDQRTGGKPLILVGVVDN